MSYLKRIALLMINYWECYDCVIKLLNVQMKNLNYFLN